MKLKALVVDDSRVMRKMVKDALSKTGLAEFEFTEAEDGMDALKKFSPANTDIIFADWNMPKLSGVDFARKVRNSNKADGIPIIMVTSEKTMGKMEIALDKAGANAYICKPFTADDMRKQVGKFIGKIAEQKAAKPSGGGGGGFFSKLMDGL